MWTKVALLAAALASAVPAFADNSSNSKPPVTRPKPKAHPVEVNSFSWGAAHSTTASGGKGGGAGKSPIGSIHVNRCKQPNPPHDCVRPRPPH